MRRPQAGAGQQWSPAQGPETRIPRERLSAESLAGSGNSRSGAKVAVAARPSWSRLKNDSAGRANIRRLEVSYSSAGGLNRTALMATHRPEVDLRPRDALEGSELEGRGAP